MKRQSTKIRKREAKQDQAFNKQTEEMERRIANAPEPCSVMEEKVNGFKLDLRKENPGLHLLYVKWAVKHLVLLDSMIQRLWSEANLNLWDAGMALKKERDRLVKKNAAYADAQEILNEIESLKLPKHEEE